MSRSRSPLWRLTIICLAVLMAGIQTSAAAAAAASAGQHGASLDALSLEDIDAQLQSCAIVQDLNAHKAAHHHHPTSSFTARLFAVVFPSASPAVNALLATLYISGPPNFLLALCPPNIDPGALSVMVAFAVGGLLGDTLFHLLPEIFLGEEEHGRVKFVLVDPNRSLLLGVAILVGFVTFVAMDKGLRIATGGGGGGGHAHGHEHHAPVETVKSVASTSAVDDSPAKGTRARRKVETQMEVVKSEAAHATDSTPSVKLAGYLNLIADFTHNITDGLAMASSFYASPTIGATTTMAVFMHEIPHEVGDFALLIQSGFSKRAAMGAQFVTAMGALLGTLIGIAIQEYGGSGRQNEAGTGRFQGLMGTSLVWGDLLLPFTAGTFLYVGTVAVIPEMLETGSDKRLELRKTVQQFGALAAGAGIML